MFIHQNDNSTTTRNNQTAQKSQKEKTMATGRANTVADIDVTKPLTQEEQALVLKHNEEESSTLSHFDILSDYYPGKYSENNFEETPVTKSFGYTNKNATIYDNPKSHKAAGAIAVGTKVEIAEVLKKYSKVSIVGNDSDTIWLSNADYSFIELGLGFVKHTALYNDIELYEAPFGEKKTIKLEAGKKYHLLKHCKNSKTNDQYSEVYPEKKSDLGREGLRPETDKPLGWVLNYQYVLSANNKRALEVAEYEKVVMGYLSEAYEKTGKERIGFVQGCLEKIWNKYKTAANYVESNPNENATVPHELIEPVRKLINIVERKSYADEAAKDKEEPNGWNYAIKEPQAEKTPVVGGSLHSDIDWNSKLGVPQYRTQSDNLSIPEATCNVTTMAMTLERLGNSRSDVIAAIDAKLKNGKEKTDDELKTLWEEKSEEYMKKITSHEKSIETAAKAKEDAAKVSKAEAEKEMKTAKGNALKAAKEKFNAAEKILENRRKKYTWRYLRGNKGGLIGKENELAKVFKENAQMEDLLDFYLYIITNKLDQRTSIFKNKYNDKIPEIINNPDYSSSEKGEVKTERIDLKGKKITNEQRARIKKTLDNGGSVVISLFHKGLGVDTHIVNVQSISSQGLILDDPYGGLVDSYRQGQEGDFFAGKDKFDRAANRNIVHVGSNKDFTKRDFTAEAAQNLEDDEKRGESKTLKWEMINESKSLIFYIVLYENN